MASSQPYPKTTKEEIPDFDKENQEPAHVHMEEIEPTNKKFGRSGWVAEIPARQEQIISREYDILEACTVANTHEGKRITFIIKPSRKNKGAKKPMIHHEDGDVAAVSSNADQDIKTDRKSLFDDGGNSVEDPSTHSPEERGGKSSTGSPRKNKGKGKARENAGEMDDDFELTSAQVDWPRCTPQTIWDGDRYRSAMELYIALKPGDKSLMEEVLFLSHPYYVEDIFDRDPHNSFFPRGIFWERLTIEALEIAEVFLNDQSTRRLLVAQLRQKRGQNPKVSSLVRLPP